VLSFSIELGVKRVCATATRAYPGDKVEALMKFVKSDVHGYSAQLYRANNRAFWALGQLGDQRALPFLKDILTGQSCDHETNLCQGEIQEAIQKLERNGFNLPKFLWRSARGDTETGKKRIQPAKVSLAQCPQLLVPPCLAGFRAESIGSACGIARCSAGVHTHRQTSPVRLRSGQALTLLLTSATWRSISDVTI